MITTVCKISYGSQTVPPIVPAVQGDTGRAINFEIADFTPPAGATATYFILKPSGEAIYNSATITDNGILCALTAQSLAEAGENRMQVRVLLGDDIVTSFEVILMVRTFLGDDAIESGTEMNIFDQAVEQATEQFQENAEQIVEEVIESIPADYTALTEEVDELNERLSKDLEFETNIERIEYVEEKLILTSDPLVMTDGHPTYDASSTVFKSKYLPCQEGDQFTISGYSNLTTIGLWAFADASGNRLSYQLTGTIENKIITAPANSAWLVINTRNFEDVSYIGKSVVEEIAEIKTDANENNNSFSSLMKDSIDAFIDRVGDISVPSYDSITGIGTDANYTEIVNGTANAVSIPIIGSNIVRFKKSQTTVAMILFTSDYPAVGVKINHYASFTGVTNTNISALATNADKYALLYIGSASIDSISDTLEILLTTSDTSNRLGDSTNLDVRKNFANIYNVYSSQVSDVPLTDAPTKLNSMSVDTTAMKIVSGGGKSIIAPIIAGTSIRVKKPQTTVCIVCFTSKQPAVNVPITRYQSFGGVVNTNIVIESQTDDNYIVVYTGSTELSLDDVDVLYTQATKGTIEILPHLDSHMVNLLKYRPVGKVKKPYIALSCDDGLEPLATYTLPRIQYWNQQYNTDIPLHMALFDQSPVLLDNTYLALVTDMCENHNCSIGIHGPAPFENYTLTYLYDFLKRQRDVIYNATGIEPTSVIYPHSSYNDAIMAMCGSWYNACGASGTDPSPCTYPDAQDRYFYVGEKSNCYEIYRLSILDTRIATEAGVETVIDYAYDNNLIICPYFHDENFTKWDAETNAHNMAMLDKFITYGMSKGIEFVNFGDIPYLI